MASTTVEDQVDALISRRVAEDKVRGAPSSDIEAASVFEAIGLNLLLNPRTVLFAANLARNGVLAAANLELQQISELRDSTRDSGNQTFEITSTTSLERAKTSLLQMEDLAKVDPDSSTFQSYSKAIDEFLNKQIAKNVKRPGVTSLVRTGQEAVQDIVSDFKLLSSYHSTLLDKLYALYVGVDNFATSPMGTILGVSTAYRARTDLQGILDEIAADNSGSQSRDFATRLITTKAALSLLGAPPNIYGAVLDTANSLPSGYELKATSADAAALSSTSTGPFTLTLSGSLTLTDGISTFTGTQASLFPAGNSAALYSAALPTGSFPLTIPSDHHLFLKVTAVDGLPGWSLASDGTYTNTTYGGNWTLENGSYSRTIRLPISENGVATSVASISALASLITSRMTTAYADAGTTANWGTAVVYNGDRLLIVMDSTFIESVSVAVNYVFPMSSTITNVIAVYSSSAHSYIGLQIGQTGSRNSVSAQTIVDSLSIVPFVTAQRNQDESVTLVTNVTSPGVYLSASGTLASDFGLPSSSPATSNFLSLSGTVFGVSQSPFNASLLVEVGDSVVTPTGSSTVSSINSLGFTLASSIPTFELGDIVVRSALTSMWDALSPKVESSMSAMLNSKFGDGLSSLDLAVASLSGDPTPGKRNAVLALLDSLETLVQSVVTNLSDYTTLLPTGSAKIERANSNGIITALVERKYDKAADYFVQCRIQEMFEMDYMTASYAGSVMKSASDVAQTDVVFPDRTKDGDTKTVLQKNRRF